MIRPWSPSPVSDVETSFTTVVNCPPATIAASAFARNYDWLFHAAIRSLHGPEINLYHPDTDPNDAHKIISEETHRESMAATIPKLLRARPECVPVILQVPLGGSRTRIDFLDRTVKRFCDVLEAEENPTPEDRIDHLFCKVSSLDDKDCYGAPDTIEDFSWTIANHICDLSIPLHLPLWVKKTRTSRYFKTLLNSGILP